MVYSGLYGQLGPIRNLAHFLSKDGLIQFKKNSSSTFDTLNLDVFFTNEEYCKLRYKLAVSSQS